MKNWKVRFGLLDCINIYDFCLRHGKIAIVDMPFVPRKGEAVWLSEKCEKELNDYVTECWEKRKCKHCPYAYGDRKSVKKIDVGDSIYVSNIIYNVEDNEVFVALQDRPIDD